MAGEILHGWAGKQLPQQPPRHQSKWREQHHHACPDGEQAPDHQRPEREQTAQYRRAALNAH